MSGNRRGFLKGIMGAAAVGGLRGANIPSAPAASSASEKELVFQRRIPVRHEVDVFVVDGFGFVGRRFGDGRRAGGWLVKAGARFRCVDSAYQCAYNA